ncbi:restriction endonuclease [Providencia rettgeri]|uniref:restriction endonuclease n=1 Tax=Providencia rettgeri TaxID=587 RepID=UPI001B364E84|nr:restriction endonuclease [Providencia rettgeri]MBQ0436810.1 restriction endonuclease [Providencia rettgeri]
MDTLVKLATIASPLISGGVAIWAILVAKKTINENKEIAKKSIADTAYQAYLQLAMENPKFSKGYRADSRLERDPVYDQYVWYVARMIFCFEQIIEVEGNLKDSSWENTLKKHLKFHSEHFKKTKVVEEALYIAPILELIKCTVKQELPL